MKNLLKRFGFVLDQFTNLKLLSSTSPVLLFDSVTAAQDIALMLGAEWDGCNGVTRTAGDEVGVHTAAKLLATNWCKEGDAVTLLMRLTADELLSRYAIGERNFSNANLRCVKLDGCALKEIKLIHAKLSWANLSQANLTGTDLTAADLSDADLTKVNLTESVLVGANLKQANLELAKLTAANLRRANLNDACLRQADLRGANLSLADLRGADLSEAQLDGACLQDTKLTLDQRQWVMQASKL